MPTLDFCMLPSYGLYVSFSFIFSNLSGHICLVYRNTVESSRREPAKYWVPPQQPPSFAQSQPERGSIFNQLEPCSSLQNLLLRKSHSILCRPAKGCNLTRRYQLVHVVWRSWPSVRHSLATIELAWGPTCILHPAHFG